jgi:hypothetical protein
MSAGSPEGAAIDRLRDSMQKKAARMGGKQRINNCMQMKLKLNQA